MPKLSRMALLLMITLLSAIGTLVDSASNKTDCDSMPNHSSCTQVMCVQLPCSMLCGVATQYDACRQMCNSRKCDVLRCRASKNCMQMCTEGTCGAMACDAKDCTQLCQRGNCSSLTCPGTVKSCTQVSGRRMICEAVACTQSCTDHDGGCEMSCPVGGTNCTQVADKGDTTMECDRGVCEQQCFSDAQCRMRCSSNLVESGRCQQACHSRDQGKCESMVCKAKQCTQTCSTVECNMTCPNEVKSCTQTAQSGNVTLRCDGDVCKQSCNYGNCNMICSASVKDCHQVCASSTCLYKCEAEKCQLSCLGSTCVKATSNSTTTTATTTTTSSTTTLITAKAITTPNIVKRGCATLQTGGSVFTVFLLALIIF